jgi:glycerol-3-phosphate acyltransferase PlsY
MSNICEYVEETDIVVTCRTYLGSVTTISVTSKYLNMLDIWLQYPWHLNIYVCSTGDYNIRFFYIFTYVWHLTTISMTFRNLRMLDLWLLYSWLVHIYECLTFCNHKSNIRKYLEVTDIVVTWPIYVNI